MRIVDFPGKGRGVVLNTLVKKGDFLMEYELECAYPRQERAQHEDEYEENNEGCMIIEVQTKKGWICLDATRKTDAIARLMNHAPPQVATARPHRAFLLHGEWRLGFVATRDLTIGEELVWNYDCPPEGQQTAALQEETRYFVPC